MFESAVECINNPDEFTSFLKNYLVDNMTEICTLFKHKKSYDDNANFLLTGESEHQVQYNHAQNVVFAKQLTKLLGKARANVHTDWIRIASVLFNIDKNALFSEFIEFSKYSSKYSIAECRFLRDREVGIDKTLTIASLEYWAKTDNFVGYMELMRNKYSQLVSNLDSCKYLDFANFMYAMFRNHLKYVSKQGWYEYREHRWISTGEKLSDSFIAEVMRTFVTFYSYKNHMEFIDKNNKLDELYIATKNHKLLRIYKLFSDGLTDNSDLMIACKAKFSDEQFESKLNAKVNLIGFNNGVYELPLSSNKRGFFRLGAPDDHISFTTGYDYIEYKLTDTIIGHVRDFFVKLQPNQITRDKLLKKCASFLSDMVKNNTLEIWHSEYAAGKSTVAEFLAYTLGDYVARTSSNTLTGKYNEESSIENFSGKRLLLISELQTTDEINMDCVKNILSRAQISTRNLYGNVKHYMPQYKALTLCNTLPKLSTNESTNTCMQMSITEWPTKFVDFTPKPGQALSDPNINEKLKSWKSAFMWLLINEYYCKNNITK